MRRYLLSILTLVGALGFGTSSWADSPHFIRAQSSLDNEGNLVCSWKEAGLGTNQNIDYVCSADATATYVCVNRGGANPSAQNKTTVSGPVSGSGTFSSGKNGQITASLTVLPPPSDLSCPPGQKLELASVSYTTVVLTDNTNGVSITMADQSSGCLLPNVRGACD
jgi:hypothetical protein